MKRRAVDWRAVAAALTKRISHRDLHGAAMGAARADYENGKRKNPRHRPRWALAFSGGADSLALLLIFWAEAPGRWGRDFTVLHFNHRLRGRAAEADEGFCREVCAALGVRFVAGRWAGAHKGSSEAEARAARFDFFRREMRRRKIRLLWLGQQRDDVAETMFMRLARGSGTGGLAAPRPVQTMPEGRMHLRPLLTLEKAEIAEALRAAGARWREDASNATDAFFRNRVRRTVIPAWRRAAGERDALAGAALSRELLEEDDVALESWVDLLAPIGVDGSLSLRRLAGKPRAIVRRALHRWLAHHAAGQGLSRQAFAALLDDVVAGRVTKHSLDAENLAQIGRWKVKVIAAGKPVARFHDRAN